MGRRAKGMWAPKEALCAGRVRKARDRIVGCRAVAGGRGSQQLGPGRPCQAVAVHPFDVERSPSMPRRARLVAAASRLKSASTFGRAADAGSAPAMAASREVAELALDLGARGPVVGGPSWVLLTFPGAGQHVFVAPDHDGRAPGRSGAAAAAACSWRTTWRKKQCLRRHRHDGCPR